MMNRQLLVTGGIASVLIAGVALDWRLFHGGVLGAEQYHQRVQAAAAAMPFRSGDWVSQETPMLPAAQKLLRPNVIISRRYQNLTNGQQAGFLLVQCLDARDLVGHYPPNCYPANGYEKLRQEPVTYVHDSLRLEGTMYTFASQKLAAHRTIQVFDFMILPDGRTAPDMAGVNTIARDRHVRQFGAAQVQIVTDAEMPEADRDGVINVLLEGAHGVIDAIRTGVRP
jgi:hypothetical protein